LGLTFPDIAARARRRKVQRKLTDIFASNITRGSDSPSEHLNLKQVASDRAVRCTSSYVSNLRKSTGIFFMPKQKHLSNPTRRSERIWCVRTYATDIPWRLRRLGVPGFARSARELWTKNRKVAEHIAHADELAGGRYDAFPFPARRCARCGRWILGFATQFQKEIELMAWLHGDASIPPCSKACMQNLPSDFGLSGAGGGRKQHSRQVRLGLHSRPGCRGGKILTDEREQLDIRWLRRMGYLDPGAEFSLRWKRSSGEIGKIEAHFTPSAMTVRWSAPEGLHGEQEIAIERTSCNYGGERHWFRCPAGACGRRVAVLYRGADGLACRHCCGLAYRTQREGRTVRLLGRVLTIRRRLGARSELEDLITRGFPSKPVGMHQKTYESLRRQYNWAVTSACH
jgi:hypothetical protein